MLLGVTWFYKLGIHSTVKKIFCHTCGKFLETWSTDKKVSVCHQGSRTRLVDATFVRIVSVILASPRIVNSTIHLCKAIHHDHTHLDA